MNYNFFIQDLESNIKYGRCYKLNKLIVNINRLLQKSNNQIVEYCKALKPEVENLKEPYDFHTRLLTSPEIDEKINQISLDLINFIKQNNN